MIILNPYAEDRVGERYRPGLVELLILVFQVERTNYNRYIILASFF